MVTGGTSLLIWATYGLVPITIPVGLVAWYYWFKYKMSYYDVADHIKQINRLIEKLHIYEMNLNEMNMNADPAMDEIKLFRAKVKTDKWRLNVYIILSRLVVISLICLLIYKWRLVMYIMHELVLPVRLVLEWWSEARAL